MPQFWKNFINNPKSMSSDSLATPLNSSTNLNNLNNNNNTRKDNQQRLNLNSKSNSFNDQLNNSTTKIPSPTDEYKLYRDKFLNSKNAFNGRVFGISLSESLSVASAEVIVQSELVSFGRIPIIVAKCGAYLKANALETSGIFRIAGNSKRVKELQFIFSTPPDYGSKFNNWDPYTVHDVASLLRRFLNNLEEPLIPLSLYEIFRDPLRNRPRILKYMASHNVSHPNANKDNNLNLKNNNGSKASIDKTNNNSNTSILRNTNNDEKIKLINNKNSNNSSSTTNISTTNNITINRKNADDNEAEDYADDDNEENDDEDDADEQLRLKKIEEERQKKKQRHRKRLSRDIRSALKEYESLFLQLSNDTKQLTIYLLDLLSLFARQSQFNLMSGRNLAAIFQPSLLSHPQHDMDPKEYELSRFVVEFLIEYSYKLLPHLLQLAKKEQQEKLSKQLSIKQNLTKDIDNSNKDSAINNTESEIGNSINRASSPNSPLKNVLAVNTNTDTNTFTSNNNTIKVTTPLESTSSISTKLSPPSVASNKYVNSNNHSSSNISVIKPKSSSNSLSPTKKLQQFPTASKKIPSNKKSSSSLMVPNTQVRRPHSRSIGSIQPPPDILTSNKRRTKLFPWLPKPGILSDTGELTPTDLEDTGDDYFGEYHSGNNQNGNNSDSNSPTGNFYLSASTPKISHLNIPNIDRSLSGNSVTSSSYNLSNNKPSMILNGNINKSSEDFDYSSANDTDDSRKIKTKRRESWFQRLTR